MRSPRCPSPASDRYRRARRRRPRLAAASACCVSARRIDGRRIAPLVAQRRAHLEGGRDAGDDLAHARSIRSCTSRLNVRTVPRSTTSCGNHVPGVAAVHLRHADHARIERMEVARDDRLQRIDRVRGEEHRILAGVRHRRVRALAGGDDLEDVVGAHQRTGAHRERAERLARPVVHAVDRAHRESGRTGPPRPSPARRPRSPRPAGR